MIWNKNKNLEITFILPTVNRKKYIIRAIESCLNINQNSIINSKVIVLDGNSDDGSWEMLNEKFSKNKNVILKQISRKLGFQETAFMGLICEYRILYVYV
mgnify:CR=1 FL=1